MLGELKHLQFVITTSLSPWHPKSDILERTIYSVKQMLGEPVLPIIYCDGVPPWATHQDLLDYDEYLNRITRLELGKIFRSDVWVGLPGLYRLIIQDLKAPVVLNVQHDWEFHKPERIDVQRLIHMLRQRDTKAGIVRFTKRPLPQGRRYVDREYYEMPLEETGGVPLIATDGWGDSPHFASKDHYLKIVDHHIVDECGEDGRYGIEGPLYRAYSRAIALHGFEHAHRTWKSCIYGRFGDEKYIVHIGDDARVWRRRRGLTAKGGLYSERMKINQDKASIEKRKKRK